MSAESDDTTHCPVCFEKFTAVGLINPRLLPCSHTLCRNCVDTLGKDADQVVCPQCRKGFTLTYIPPFYSFPENKYIVKAIKDRAELKSKIKLHQREADLRYVAARKVYEEKLKDERQKFEQFKEEMKPKFELCADHDRETVLYCRSPRCDKPICTVCLYDAHGIHDTVDRERYQTEKSEAVKTKIDTICQELICMRENALSTRNELESKYERCEEDIYAARDLELKRIAMCFNHLIVSSQQALNDNTRKIDKFVLYVDETIENLNEIKARTDGMKPRKELDSCEKELNGLLDGAVEFIISKKKEYKYFEYQKVDVSKKELETLRGFLIVKETDQEEGDEAEPEAKRRRLDPDDCDDSDAAENESPENDPDDCDDAENKSQENDADECDDSDDAENDRDDCDDSDSAENDRDDSDDSDAAENDSPENM